MQRKLPVLLNSFHRLRRTAAGGRAAGGRAAGGRAGVTAGAVPATAQEAADRSVLEKRPLDADGFSGENLQESNGIFR